jgi:hypothetical protein
MYPDLLGNSTNITVNNASYDINNQPNNNQWLYSNITTTDVTVKNFTNIYSGIAWVKINANSTAYIHSAKANANNQAVGIGITRSGTNAITVFMYRGTIAGNGGITETFRVFNSTPVTATGGWVKIVWLFNTTQANSNSDRIFINNNSQTLNAFTYEAAVNYSMVQSIIFGPGTPVGFKIGTLWVTMSSLMTPTLIQGINNNWGSEAPFFLGRYGEYPLGDMAYCYSCGNDATPYNYPNRSYYVQNGPKNYIRVSDNIAIGA